MVPAGSRTAVQHRTQAGLTSGFRWDRVYPCRYGRHTKIDDDDIVFIDFEFSVLLSYQLANIINMLSLISILKSRV